MKARIVFLALTWLSAFVIVMALFLAFGFVLDDLPLAARALTISGVLAISMTQFVIPLINRFLRARGIGVAAKRDAADVPSTGATSAGAGSLRPRG
jgi:antibiotic biosynthesis monooxygenase (ABM) superfamily enzyme